MNSGGMATQLVLDNIEEEFCLFPSRGQYLSIVTSILVYNNTVLRYCLVWLGFRGDDLLYNCGADQQSDVTKETVLTLADVSARFLPVDPCCQGLAGKLPPPWL